MKNLSHSFVASLAIGLIFPAVGFALVFSGYSSLGSAFFFFLPLALGISSGTMPERHQAIKGTLISLAIFSVILFFTAMEGLVCILMATPILIGAVWLGWFIGSKIKRPKNKDNINFSLMPLLLFFVVNFFEMNTGNIKFYSSIETSLIIPNSKAEVYDNIIDVDTVSVPLSNWHKLGLPIPVKCILTEEKVGGLRLCKFQEGEIIETIKELRKNEYLRMEVTKCELGKERKWLQFDEDIYRIEDVGNNKSKVTRTTTYYSNLKPRAYWELMEKITITAEHDFVFRNLEKDLQK